MDDDKLGSAYFPLQDTEIKVRQPSEGQILVLMNLRSGKDHIGRTVKRIMTVLEKIISSEDWDWIEDGLLAEVLSVKEFFDFAEQIMRFDWNEDRPEPEAAPEPVRRAPRRA